MLTRGTATNWSPWTKTVVTVPRTTDAGSTPDTTGTGLICKQPTQLLAPAWSVTVSVRGPGVASGSIARVATRLLVLTDCNPVTETPSPSMASVVSLARARPDSVTLTCGAPTATTLGESLVIVGT